MEQLKAQLHSASRVEGSAESWMLDEGRLSGKKSSFSAGELEGEELGRMEACRPVRLWVHA